MSPRRPRLSKRDRFLAGLAGALGPLFLSALGATWRVRVDNESIVDEIHLSGRPIVFGFWHGGLLPLEYVYRGRGLCVLSSWHKDGEISARLMTGLGYRVVRGSSTRGSARGLMRMLRMAVEGVDLAITPDGPRGPAGSIKRGIFYLAERSGAALVPVGVCAEKAVRLSSWDRFTIPYPLSRVDVVYGEPLEWNEKWEFGAKADVLRSALDCVTLEAECRTGSTER